MLRNIRHEVSVEIYIKIRPSVKTKKPRPIDRGFLFAYKQTAKQYT
jgi:hypothetical protein